LFEQEEQSLSPSRTLISSSDALEGIEEPPFSDTLSSETLEGLKQRLEEFVDSSQEVKALEAKGIQLDYFPDDPRYHDNDLLGSNQERIKVNIPGANQMTFGLFAMTGYDGVSYGFLYEVSYRLNPTENFLLLGGRKSVPVGSETTPEELIEKAFSSFKWKFIKLVDEQYVIAQKPQLSMAEHVVEWLEKRHENIEVVRLQDNYNSVVVELRVKLSNTKSRELFVNFTLKLANKGFSSALGHLVRVSVTSEQGTLEHDVSLNTEDYLPELSEFLLGAVYQ
jgi:hypothetical protein